MATFKQIRIAKRWLLSKADNYQELEDLFDWVDNVTNDVIIERIERDYDGGWKEFLKKEV